MTSEEIEEADVPGGADCLGDRRMAFDRGMDTITSSSLISDAAPMPRTPPNSATRSLGALTCSFSTHHCSGKQVGSTVHAWLVRGKLPIRVGKLVMC